MAQPEQPRRSVRLALLLLGSRAASFLRGGATKVEGYCKHRIAMDFLYRPRPDDLFIAGYPKSGSTLLQMMLYQMTTDGEMDLPHIESFSPFFEECFRVGVAGYLEEMPSPRVFKTHLEYGRMPRRRGRCIYLVRDLRDVAVSAFHHHRMVRGWGPQEELRMFVNGILSGRTMFDSWFRHTRSWWPHRHDPDVLFLRYEEVIADLPGTMRRIADFCGLPLTDEIAARVLERCSVAFMKQHNEKFDPRLRQLEQGRREFIRNGVAGEGRVRLHPAQEQRIARSLADLGRQLGCTPEEPGADLFFGNALSAIRPPSPPASLAR